MVRLEKLISEHYRRLYEICLRVEPFNSRMLFEQYAQIMSQREGFTIITDNNEIIGVISFSDLVPNTQIIIHCVVDEEHQLKWCSRDLLKQIADYVYRDLGLPRMASFCVAGVSDKAGDFLMRLGFTHEGTVRKGVKLHDGLFDLKLFGLLKEECTWL